MTVWQSFARISGVAFQVFAAVGLGIFLGYLVDRLAPPATPWGILAGAVIGFGAAVWVMVTGMRAYVSAETSTKLDPAKLKKFDDDSEEEQE